MVGRANGRDRPRREFNPDRHFGAGGVPAPRCGEPAPLSRRAARARRAPGRRVGRLAGGRSRRRQSKSRLPRARTRGRPLREAGAALRAADRRKLAAAARPRLLRARGAGGARPPCAGPHARGLPFRPRADADGDGAAGAPHHHAARHDPGHPLPARSHRHGRIHGADALLHLRPRDGRGGEEGARRGLLRQHVALQDHRRPDLHRALHGLRQQLLDYAAARRHRRRVSSRCATKAGRLPASSASSWGAPRH